LTIEVDGPGDDAKVDVADQGDGNYAVTYFPTTPGVYKISVKYDGEHIPGSVFTVECLEEISLGGEGKIRVFFSTTSSNQKGRSDVKHLEHLFEAKKVHLRPDFEPWIAVDIMDRADREAVFTKAGTRTLPIVFVDDKYCGDYDRMKELEEDNKLDGLLVIKGVKLLTEAEHQARMAVMDIQGGAAEAKEQHAPKGKAFVPKAAAPAPVAKKKELPPITSQVASTGGPYTYQQLTCGAFQPTDVDPTKRESYLSDAEFQEVFGMDRGAFGKLAGWKRKKLKGDKKLH